jgi:hypothetical protein
MQSQHLFETPFVLGVGIDDCSKYVSSKWKSSYHWQRCHGTLCKDFQGRRGRCIRPGAGKCICRSSEGDEPPPFNPNYYEAQWLFETPFVSEVAHFSASTPESYMEFRPVSLWPRLLNQATQAIKTSITHLKPPQNLRAFDNALNSAKYLLNKAAIEIQKVIKNSPSVSRQSKVLDHIVNALIRIDAARAQSRGASLTSLWGGSGGRSLLDPEGSLFVAIESIQLAREAIGLQLVGK